MIEKEETKNYSPEKKKITYYEQDPKLLKKERARVSFKKIDIEDYDNENEYEGINFKDNKLNFQDDDFRVNNEMINFNMNSFTQGEIVNNNNININSQINSYFDELLSDLDKKINAEDKVKQNSMKSDFSDGCGRSSFSTYFQSTRTQPIWEDFHLKRDKI